MQVGAGSRCRDEERGKPDRRKRNQPTFHFVNHIDGLGARGPSHLPSVVAGELADEPRQQGEHDRQDDTELPEHKCVEGQDDNGGEAAEQDALPLQTIAPADQEAEARQARRGPAAAPANSTSSWPMPRPSIGLGRDVGVHDRPRHALVRARGHRRQVLVDVGKQPADDHDLVLQAVARGLGERIVGRAQQRLGRDGEERVGAVARARAARRCAAASLPAG